MSYLENFQYQILGDNTENRCVFLHGLMGSLSNWRKITSALKSQYQVLIFDQRGHGRSFQPKQGYTPYDYAGDLRNILAELEWDRIHLVGHSMGGRNAMAFADQYSGLLKSLVIEDIGVVRSPKADQRIRNFLSEIPTPFANKELAKSYFEGPFLQVEKANPVLAQYFYSNLVANDQGQMDWRFYKEGILKSMELGREEDFAQVLSRIPIPTLIIRGEHSEDLLREDFLKMCEFNPLIQGVEISGAGHWVHFDQAQEFIKTILEFFNNIK